MKIWLDGSKQGHDFIDDGYWESNQKAMKDVYFPMSQSYIIEENDSIVGFISVVDNYLAALFVDANEQGKGYGKMLLEQVKDQKEYLELKVYQENKKALGFYLKNGFNILEESLDENTSAKEYIMTWKREQ